MSREFRAPHGIIALETMKRDAIFHMRSGYTDADAEGVELASLDAARAEAVKASREMVAERVFQNEGIAHLRFEITGENGKILEVVIKLD